jgi:hypothetical protein
MTSATTTVYELIAAQARADQLRKREIRRRQRELNLDELRQLLGDLDVALSAVTRAVSDGDLCAEQLHEAAVCKEQLDRLWEVTLKVGRRETVRASLHASMHAPSPGVVARSAGFSTPWTAPRSLRVVGSREVTGGQ